MNGYWAAVLAAAALWVLLGPGPGWRRAGARGPTGERRPTGERWPTGDRGPTGSEGHGPIHRSGTSGTSKASRRPAPGTPQQQEEPRLTGDDSALLLELAATLLDAGLPVTRILLCLAVEIPGCRPLRGVVRSLEFGLPWDRAWESSPPVLARLGDGLAFAHLTGAGTAGLLRAAAEQQRHADDRAAEYRAAELAVKMVVPLGLCALPAFICLGIIPVVIALLPQLG